MLLIAIGFAVNYVVGLQAYLPRIEGLALSIAYLLVYLVLISSNRMQPFQTDHSHLPELPSYSMAAPATPLYRPQTSPLAASYTPPSYGGPPASATYTAPTRTKS
jgi:hypothetical protein